MGIFSTIGGFLGPVGSLVGSGLDYVGNAVIGGISQNAANNRDDEIRNQQHQWMIEENAKDRAWQSEEARLARQSAQAYESAEWDRRQAYMSPAQQAQRLIAAGVNPAALDGSAAGQAVSSPSAPSNQATGSHSVGNASGADSGILTAGYLNINRLFDSANKIADLAKKTQELPYMRDFVQRQIALLDKQASQVQADTTYREFLNSVNSIIGTKRYSDNELAKWQAELNKLRSSADLDDASARAKVSEDFLNSVRAMVSSQEYEKLKIEVENWDNKIKQDIAYVRAQEEEQRTRASANVAQAETFRSQTRLNNALRETENQLREYKVLFSRYQGEEAMEKSVRAWKEHSSRILADLNQMEREGLTNAKLEQDIIRASNENDWWKVRQLIEYAEMISRAAWFASSTGQNIMGILKQQGSAGAGAAQYVNAPVIGDAVGASAPVPLIVP